MTPFTVVDVGVGCALLPPVGVRLADMDGDWEGDDRDDGAPFVWMPGGGGRLILPAPGLWLGTEVAVAVATGAMIATVAAAAD